MSHGKIFLLVVSALVVLIGVGLFLGGGSILWANVFMKDADGFYTTRKVEVERDSYAITSEPAEVEVDSLRVLNWLESIEVRITAENNHDKGVFVGIAPEDDLQSYLNGVEHDQVVDLDLNHPIGIPKISYEEFSGNNSPEEPTGEEFWAASASGSGEQVLRWKLEEGTYATALMNADGSRGVDVTASIGAKVPVLNGLALWLTIAGLVVILLAFVSTYLIVTRSRI